MRLLITGASGLLGLNLGLESMGLHDVVGVHRGAMGSLPFDTIQADLTEPGMIRRVLDKSRAQAVVHCAAAADLDFCEKNPSIAWQVNAWLPQEIATACANANIRLIHVSTDAVFDGNGSSLYSENSPPNPIGVYAATKYAGEMAVTTANPEALVVRVNFYGWSMSGTRSLAEFFVNNLSQGIPVSGFTDVIFCPMLVNDLGSMLLQMIELDLHGLYHAVGPEAMSKYLFGVKIARRFGFDEKLISPKSVDGSGLTARRAHNLRLSTHKLSTDLGKALPNFSTGLGKFYTQYKQGYPQKIRNYLQASETAYAKLTEQRTPPLDLS